MWELWDADRKTAAGTDLLDGLVELWRVHIAGAAGSELVTKGERYGIPKMPAGMGERLNAWVARGGDLRIVAGEYLENYNNRNQRHATEAVFLRMLSDEEWPPLPPQELISEDRRLRAVCQRGSAFAMVHVEDAAAGELKFQTVRVHEPQVELIRFITPSRLLLRYPEKGTYSELSLDPVGNETVVTPIVLEDPRPDRLARIIIWVLIGFLEVFFIAGAVERFQRGHLLVAAAFLVFALAWIVAAWVWQNRTWTQHYDLAKGTLVDIRQLWGYTKRREFSFSDFDLVAESEAYYKGRKFKATELRGRKGRINVIGAPDPKWIADRLGLPVRLRTEDVEKKTLDRDISRNS